MIRRATARALLALALGVSGTFASRGGCRGRRTQTLAARHSAAGDPGQGPAVGFHDELLIIITLITLFVLGLLVYVMWRFNQQRNPVPSRTSHNTLIEMLWTVVPVLILVIIAIPSFKLLYYMDRVPNPDMTIKVTGHQWYWTYEYPDNGNLTFDSNIIPEDRSEAGPAAPARRRQPARRAGRTRTSGSRSPGPT